MVATWAPVGSFTQPSHVKRMPPIGSTLTQVFQATRSLSTFSERGWVVPDLNDPEVHQVLVGRYRVLYEVHPEAVWIMRVLHTSQDLLLALGRRSRGEAEGGE